VKPSTPKDFQREERTDPGAASADAPEDAPADDSDDAFPSEATRIDSRPMAGAQLAAAHSAGAPQRPGLPTRPAASPTPNNAVANPSIAKLAALKSLSLNADPLPSSSRLPPQPRGTGNNSNKLPWILLAGVLLAVGGNWLRTRNQVDPRIPTGAPEIRTELVTPTGGSGQAHMAAGYTAALAPISVGVPSGGRVKELKVQNGDKVTRGQIIVLLDDSSALAELSLARAQVSNAQQRLAQQNMLFKAQATTMIEVSRARGDVSIAVAQLRPIQQRIDQTRIKAPIDATVLEVLLRPGESAAPNAAIVKVADLSQLIAEVDINEADLVKVRREQEVDVTSDAFPDKRYKGKVREIAGQADKAKGTVTVRVELEVPDLSLRPGMSVKCSFQPIKGDKPRIFISRSSLTTDGVVWVVGSDRRILRRPVTIQPAAGSSVEVLTGLSGGERIVVDANAVHEGQVLAPSP